MCVIVDGGGERGGPVLYTVEPVNELVDFCGLLPCGVGRAFCVSRKFVCLQYVLWGVFFLGSRLFEGMGRFFWETEKNFLRCAI